MRKTKIFKKIKGAYNYALAAVLLFATDVVYATQTFGSDYRNQVSGDAGQVGQKVTQEVGFWGEATLTICQILGICAFAWGAHVIKQKHSGESRHGYGAAIGGIIAGIILYFIPSFLGLGANSLLPGF